MTNYNTLLWFPLGTKLERVRLGALWLVVMGASWNLTDVESTVLAVLLLSRRMLGRLLGPADELHRMLVTSDVQNLTLLTMGKFPVGGDPPVGCPLIMQVPLAMRISGVCWLCNVVVAGPRSNCRLWTCCRCYVGCACLLWLQPRGRLVLRLSWNRL